jgi:hypothetical protein
MDRTDLLNKVAAAMQDEIGVTGDPGGDYDIAISSAAVVAVDILAPIIETFQERERVDCEACVCHPDSPGCAPR